LAALGERQKIIVDVSSTHNIPEFQLEITNESKVTEFFNLLRDRQKLVVTKLQSTKVKHKRYTIMPLVIEKKNNTTSNIIAFRPQVKKLRKKDKRKYMS
jgi:hypothetical protein